MKKLFAFLLACVCALALFDKDRDAGTAAMNLLRGPRPMTPYDAQFLRDRLRGKAYLPLAYFEGATPENGYQPRAPYRLNVLADPRPQDIEPGYLRVFLKTAGADSPRPMKLRQKASTGEWFLWEYSSILSGKELTLCGRRNSDPITSSESNFLSVNNNFSFARKDTVNFFVCFMRMYERNIGSCRKIINTYFSTCERKGFVKFNSTFISDICFCIVCHGMYLHFS